MRAATFSNWLIRDSYVITRGEALYHRGKEGERKEEGDGRGRERKAGREEKKEKRNGNEGEPVIPIPFKTLLTREYTLCVYVSSFFFLFFVFSLYNKKPKVFFKDEFNLSGMDGLVRRSFWRLEGYTMMRMMIKILLESLSGFARFGCSREILLFGKKWSMFATPSIDRERRED